MANQFEEEDDGCSLFDLSDLNDLIDDNNDSTNKKLIQKNRRETHKSVRKPKWWFQQYAGGNSRGTKAQRRARVRLGHYCVPSIRFGCQIDVDGLFHYDNSIAKVSDKEFWIELGFGEGQVLRTNARNYPAERLYIGADVHLPGVGNILLDMEKHDNSVDADSDDSYKYLQNVRVYPGDGLKLIQALPDQSCDCILMTFPDPMYNDPKYRIIQESALDLFEQKLKFCNNLQSKIYNNFTGRFILATDAKSFAEWTSSIFERRIQKQRNDKKSTNKQQNGRWIKEDPPPREEWLPIQSKYEKKGITEGRDTICLCWRYERVL